MGGLGTAICQELAKAGHKVVASYHPQFDNKDEWLKEMAEAGFKDFVCVAGDVVVPGRLPEDGCRCRSCLRPGRHPDQQRRHHP
jgi:NAD(P)-dependent dehydrogenase (short-subunit alcohol dehydrogenase family)